MIRLLSGKINYIEKDYIVLNVNGIGFRIFMPNPYLEYITSESIDEITAYIYMAVRDDAIQLYGFLNKDELELFEMLISVSGIGPKGALNILSILPGDELKFALYSGDSKAIAKAPGIGKKTAEKCIVELKDKINLEDTISTEQSYISKPSNLDNTTLKEAIEALVALGYTNKDATNAVKSVAVTEDTNVEDILKDALKYII